jgi:hypothetical protein
MSKQRDAPAVRRAQSGDEPIENPGEAGVGTSTAPILPPARSLSRRLLHLSLDLLGAAGWTWMAVAIPLPVISEYLTVKNALIAFVAIIWVGRAIVDTFFYDRHP